MDIGFCINLRPTVKTIAAAENIKLLRNQYGFFKVIFATTATQSNCNSKSDQFMIHDINGFSCYCFPIASNIIIWCLASKFAYVALWSHNNTVIITITNKCKHACKGPVEWARGNLTKNLRSAETFLRDEKTKPESYYYYFLKTYKNHIWLAYFQINFDLIKSQLSVFFFGLD